MDDTTNQPSTTPLGNERSSTPGNDNPLVGMPSLPNIDENTSLDDIQKQYTDLGTGFTNVAENAADNVGDRQVQLVGNDFGATNPYMYNTYYEPSATAFASEMRQQGTQKALEVGLDRAEDEANKNLEAAKQRYNNALAAAKKKEEERKNAKAHVSETDTSKLPDNTSEEEVNNFAKATEGMTDEERKEHYRTTGISEIQSESSPLNWDDATKRKEASASAKKKFGITDAQWKKMSKEERQAFWDRKDVGNYWTEFYMRNYFKENSDADKMMESQFDRMNSTADKIVDAIKKSDFSNLTNADTDLMGVKVSAPVTVDSVEKLREGIRKSEKYSDEEKAKYDSALAGVSDAIQAANDLSYYLKGKGIMSADENLKENLRYMPEYEKSEIARRIASVKSQVTSSVNAAKEAFANMDQTDINELLAETNTILASYAGGTDGKATDKSNEDKLNAITSGFGVSYDSWKNITKMKTERPDDYTYLRDHASFIAAGGAGAFETVKDDKKKYYINGKWVSAGDKDSPIAVGDIIFHSVDGTVNEEGEYNDKDLKNFVEQYRKIYTGQEEYTDEKGKALQKSYNQYAKRLAASFYLARRYDLKVDENIYNTVLYLDGAGSSDKLTVTNPVKPGEKVSIDGALQWFKSLNGDQQNIAYAEIAKRARESTGYLLLSDIQSGQLYNAPLKQNGVDTIGQYGKSAESGANNEPLKDIANLTDEDCLALNMLIDNAMKNGSIDKGFLAYDGVPLGDVLLNSADKNFHGFIDFFKWAGASVGALVTSPFTEGGYEKNQLAQAAGEVWDSMTEINEADNHRGNADEVRGNYYTQEVRIRQADNLNHLIDTTFNIEYFNPENEIDSKTGQVKNKKGEAVNLTDNSYWDQYGAKNLGNNVMEMTGAIGEFVAESLLTAGAATAAKAALKGVKAGVKAVAGGTKLYAATSKFVNSAKRILTATASPTGLRLAISDIKAGNIINNVASKVGNDAIVKGVLDGTYKSLGNAVDDAVRQGVKYADDVARAASGTADDVAREAVDVAVDAAKSSADNVVSSSADNVAAETIKSSADDVAKTSEDTAVSVLDMAKQAKNEAKEAAPQVETMNRLTKQEIKELDKQLQEAKGMLQKSTATKYGLDAVVDNVDNAADSLAKRISQKLNSAWDNTYISKKMVTSMRDSIDDGLATAAKRAAINTRISAASGISAERLAALPDSVSDVLYGILRYTEQNSDNLIHAVSLNPSNRKIIATGKDILLKNIDFKKVAEAVVSRAETYATKHIGMNLDDIFRVIATESGAKPSALIKSLKFDNFVRDRVKDWSRDIAQNYWSPELDQNFNSHYVDFETYITSPEQILMGVAFDVGSSFLSRSINRLKLGWTNHQINKIMGGIDLTTPNAADAAKMRKNMVKLDNLRSRAVKLNGQILDGKISYEKIHDVAQNAEESIKKHISAIAGDLDMSQASFVIDQSAVAMDEARAALSTGTLKGKRMYKRILADADQVNRMIIRGNDKLMAFQEVNNALQQTSITRYLDIETKAKTIHKLTGEQWGTCISHAWKEIKEIDFAKEFGELDENSFTGYTINVKDKAKAKDIYAAGQTIVYDKIYNKVRDVMGDALTTEDYRNLKAELNGIRDRMVAAGADMIDEGKKVRWNYLPTQALTWEAEPGTASAVRALWGWDYKGGTHTSIAGEINSPTLARDQFDYDKIISDYNNGNNTFKRRVGDRAKAVEEGKTGKTAASYRDVAYNWQGFDPAYACNAYLNAYDSAKYVAPLLDPINGIAIKNPAAALSVSNMMTRVSRARIAELSDKYADAVENIVEKKSAAKGKRTTKASLEHRAKLVEDLSGKNVRSVLDNKSNGKISKNEAKLSAANTKLQQDINNSPIIKAVSDLYRDAGKIDAAKTPLATLSRNYNELGQDILAVRNMYDKAGNLKKKYLGKDGNIKAKYLDIEGNIVPEGTSTSFNDANATQYRKMVNQLAGNKTLTSDRFSPDYSRVIKFDDGTQINAMAFQKDIYNVLMTKSEIDANMGRAPRFRDVIPEGEIMPDSRTPVEKLIDKRLQPVDVEGDNARSILTGEARKMIDDVYGTWNDYTKKRYVDRSSKNDKIFQAAINNAFDDAQAAGGQINCYEFMDLVDNHIPDFVKQAGAKGSAITESLDDVISYLRSYDASGGNIRELLDDLRAARAAETDATKIKVLDDAIYTVEHLDDYNLRTTGKAGLDANTVSLDSALDDEDADLEGQTFQDITTGDEVMEGYDSVAAQQAEANMLGKNVATTDVEPQAATTAQVAKSGSVSPTRSVTSLKSALDILHDNPESGYRKRADYRIERKNAFETVEKKFNSLANKLEDKAAGKSLATAYDVLPNNQVLTPDTIKSKLHESEAVLSKKAQRAFDDYNTSYEYAKKAKSAETKAKTKKTLVEKYKKLATAVNEDQARIAQKARVEGGTGIYRGNNVLSGASDVQYLQFANVGSEHRVTWDSDFGGDTYYYKNGSVVSPEDNHVADYRNALIAGRDGYGNMTFMDPSKIDEFIKKNNIALDADLKKELDEYRALYASNKDTVLNPAYRRYISDTTVGTGDSLVEYYASQNSGDLHTTKMAKENSPSEYHGAEEYYSTRKGIQEAENTQRNLNKFTSSTSNENAMYGGLEGAGLYDWTGEETVSAAKKEANEAYNEAGKTAKQRYQRAVDSGRLDKASSSKKRAYFERLVEDELNKLGYDGDDIGASKQALYESILERETGYRSEEDFLTARAKENTRNKTATSLDDYEIEDDGLGRAPVGRYVEETPFTTYLDATSDLDVATELDTINKKLYGNGDKAGYFDYVANIKNEINDDLGYIDEKFDEHITDKVTSIKKLDGAKDGEVVAILEAAKQEAGLIESKTARDYIIKRLDEEIEFAKENLQISDKKRDKILEDFVKHDPDYRAYKSVIDSNKGDRPNNKVSAQVPNGASPLFLSGDITPEGHITLQQLMDARKVVDLERKKNGKNSLKSSKQTRDILKSMRTDFNDGYDGSSLISSGAAQQQSGWVLNLYARIHESAGFGKLPETPSFDDIAAGSMKLTSGEVIELPLKLSDIYIDPKIASLGSHYWGEGRATSVEWVYKRATALSDFNKAIQDIQLAGGVGQFNAFTLRNAITMMWQDPIGGTRALFSNFKNARSNDSVINFYLNNHDKLLKMAIDSGDWSAINGFVNVVNMRDEVGGRGMIQDFGHQIAEIPNVFQEKGLIKGTFGSVKNLYESIFENPTFVRWMVVAKADLNLRNYNKAERYVRRMVRRYDLTEDDFANVKGGMGSMDRYIATIAQLRSDKYWQPAQFALKANNAEKYMVKQDKLRLKQTTEALRGMPQKKSLRSCFSDFFFAISYKLQMNAHPVDGIATIFTALPNNARASINLKNRTSFNVATSRFIGRGNRNEAMVMVGIAALAHAWNTSIGAPSAWEELWGDHGKVENGTYGIAQSLLNFQDFGKFWLPNTKDGKFDPTQRAASIDPFFSIFTLQNSAMRAANKAFFPNQIPYNWQRTTGAGLLQATTGTPMLGAPTQGGLMDRINGVKDELIGANLLSGYKAIYEVLNNSTYFGNNIWERKYLPDGSENPNYNALRNLMASVAHILNLEEFMLGDTTNRWVKGLDIDTQTWKDGKQVDPYSVGPKIGKAGKYIDKTGTVAGSGIIQHEYLTALKKVNEGDYFDALTESMELPFKTRNYASRARTQLNSEVMLALRNAKHEYDEAVKNADVATKDEEYAKFAKKAVNIMHDWSAKNQYVLGDNDELTATATKIVLSFMADEYNDLTNKIQTRYDKIRQDLKMADGEEFLFSNDAMEAAIADGMDAEEAAAKHNAHLKALQEAYIKEYDARQALLEAGIDPDVFDTASYIHDDLSAVSATFDKKTYAELTAKFKQPIGEFKNFEEMKNYYEELIKNASTTKQKVKLAETYNKYVTDIISPYVGSGFAAQAFNDVYWDGNNLSNELGKYIIIPADKYYSGKAPRASYLKDLLGIGWRDNHNLPSDKQITEQIAKATKALANGQVSSAGALIDNALVQLRKGTLHASPEDENKLIRMRALLSSRRK